MREARKLNEEQSKRIMNILDDEICELKKSQYLIISDSSLLSSSLRIGTPIQNIYHDDIKKEAIDKIGKIDKNDKIDKLEQIESSLLYKGNNVSGNRVSANRESRERDLRSANGGKDPLMASRDSEIKKYLDELKNPKLHLSNNDKERISYDSNSNLNLDENKNKNKNKNQKFNKDDLQNTNKIPGKELSPRFEMMDEMQNLKNDLSHIINKINLFEKNLKVEDLPMQINNQMNNPKATKLNPNSYPNLNPKAIPSPSNTKNINNLKRLSNERNVSDVDLEKDGKYHFESYESNIQDQNSEEYRNKYKTHIQQKQLEDDILFLKNKNENQNKNVIQIQNKEDKGTHETQNEYEFNDINLNDNKNHKLINKQETMKNENNNENENENENQDEIEALDDPGEPGEHEYRQESEEPDETEEPGEPEEPEENLEGEELSEGGNDLNRKEALNMRERKINSINSQDSNDSKNSKKFKIQNKANSKKSRETRKSRKPKKSRKEKFSKPKPKNDLTPEYQSLKRKIFPVSAKSQNLFLKEKENYYNENISKLSNLSNLSNYDRRSSFTKLHEKEMQLRKFPKFRKEHKMQKYESTKDLFIESLKQSSRISDKYIAARHELKEIRNEVILERKTNFEREQTYNKLLSHQEYKKSLYEELKLLKESYKQLQISFDKSEEIRKFQKKLITNLQTEIESLRNSYSKPISKSKPNAIKQGKPSKLSKLSKNSKISKMSKISKISKMSKKS